EAITNQWYLGQAGDTHTLLQSGPSNTLHVAPHDYTNYWVRLVASGGCEIDSDTLLVKVCKPESVAGNNDSVRLGSWGFLNPTVTGTELTYEWHRKNADGSINSAIDGTSRALWVRPYDTTIYQLTITDVCGR